MKLTMHPISYYELTILILKQNQKQCMQNTRFYVENPKREKTTVVGDDEKKISLCEDELHNQSLLHSCYYVFFTFSFIMVFKDLFMHA